MICVFNSPDYTQREDTNEDLKAYEESTSRNQID